MVVERLARSDSWREEFIRVNRSRCHYCNRSGAIDFGPDDRPWHIDHKTPLARGGSEDDDNLALACKRCNLTKGVQPYAQFKEFARAAFWVPDDWRASEAELDRLMLIYNNLQSAHDDEGPWLANRDDQSIVQIGPDGIGCLQTVFKLGDDMKNVKYGGQALFLVEDMFRLMPAMIAELRLLRSESKDF